MRELTIRILAAVLDRLIPTDEHGPGAVDAGVLDYVTARYAGAGRSEARLYAAGLADLDERCLRQSGTIFAAASEITQDRLLAELEAESLATPESARSGTFFETVLQHAREGMFGDPVHGGNRDHSGWDLLGYPDARRVWTAADQAIDATVLPLSPRRAAAPRVRHPETSPSSFRRRQPDGQETQR